MTAVAVDAKARLDIGKVISQTIEVLSRQWLPFVGALIVVTLPSFLFNLAQMGRLSTALQNPGNTAALASAQFGANPVLGLLLLIWGLFSGPVVLGAILYGTVKQLDGAPDDLPACLQAGLRNWFGMVLLIILWALGCMVGTILLVVPGIMLMAAWSASLPAKVVEGLGPVQSLGRSLELTRGRRWSIFFLGLILVVVLLVIEGTVMGLLSIGGGAAIGGAARFMTNPVGVVALTLFGLAMNLFMFTLTGALYHQLRALRDGPTAQALGEIFA